MSTIMSNSFFIMPLLTAVSIVRFFLFHKPGPGNVIEFHSELEIVFLRALFVRCLARENTISSSYES